MKNYNRMKNIFADKATLILRRMINHPNRQWVVRDFTGPRGVSLGMAQGVLDTMEKLGYVERIKKGPDSYTILTDKERLINDWLKEYRFELNEIDTYYTARKSILKEMRTYLNDKQYALTLHTGANLITSFVRTDHVYLYFNSHDRDKDVLEMRQRLDLKELVSGGNFHIIRPYYKSSIFIDIQKIKGYRIVSNLQLYLDLYNFRPRGREHAEYLKKLLEDKGKSLD